MEANSLPKIERAVKQPFNFNVVNQVAQTMFEEANTPFSLALSILLKEGEFSQLVNAKASLDGDLQTVSKNIACESLLRKYPAFKHVDLDPVQTARVSFLDAEALCARTNSRINEAIREPGSELFELLLEVGEEVSDILGDFNADEWHNGMSFGPGKGLGTDAVRVAPYYKMSVRPTYSGPDPTLAEQVVRTCPGWADVGKTLKSCASSELCFVPKNAKTHRAICIEPIVNLFAQKGIGKMIRRRLRVVGCDLDHGQDRQRVLARKGSVNSLLCTLDLKAASDTIAYKLVEAIMPRRWFHAMAAFRSPATKEKELGVVRLSKFSSMGNGYTFELESLIFYSLVRVCRKRLKCKLDYGVYGDDIIVSTALANELTRLLGLMGFQLNQDKSHTRGYFRESCGGNYYDGYETTTLYIDQPVGDVRDAFLLANRLHVRAISSPCAATQRCFERARSTLVNAIPKPARCLTYPDSLGESDIGLAVRVEAFSFNSYDADLQLWYGESMGLISRPIEVRMDSVWSAKAHLLYEVERSTSQSLTRVRNAKWDWTHFNESYPKLARQRITSSKEKVKIFSEFSLVPHRGSADPQLKCVRYYETHCANPS